MRAVLVFVLCACNTPGPPPSSANPATAPKPVGPVASLAVGMIQACAIEATGKVACWGLDHPTPFEVQGLDDVAGIAEGLWCAWTTHGAVYCWGEHGTDTYALDDRAYRVPDLDDIIQVIDGLGWGYALHANGRVSRWEVGRDPLWSRPHEIDGLTDAIEIAPRRIIRGDNVVDHPHTHSENELDENFDHNLCARLKSGDVVCGEPRQFTVVPALAGATSLTSDGIHLAALLPGHRLRLDQVTLDDVDGERVVVSHDRACVIGPRPRCWSSWHGGSSADPDPRPLPAGLQDLAMANEGTMSCARIRDQVGCWGRVGLLGDGSTEYPAGFVPIGGITDAQQLETDGRDEDSHLCVLRKTGRVTCWGKAEPPRDLPIADARQLETAGGAMCVLRKTGQIACWGEPLARRDDDDHFDEHVARSQADLPEEDRGSAAAEPFEFARPYELPGAGVDEIAMAGFRSPRSDRPEIVQWAIVCARHKSGATCWYGKTQSWDPPELASAVKLYASPQHVCGVTARGAVHCTPLYLPGTTPPPHDEDHALSGRLHDALATGRELPPRVHGAGDSDRSDEVTGEYQNRKSYYVVATGGAVKHVRPPGSDDDGVDPPIDGLTGVVQLRRIAWTGDFHERGVLCARRSDGTVACWGEREYLGTGERTERTDPVTVRGVVMGPKRSEPANAGERGPKPPIAPPAPSAPPAGEPSVISPHPMQGPYPDAAHACAAAKARDATACKEHETDDMPSPPPPFSRVQLVSSGSGSFRGDHVGDDLHRMRLMVTRPDGVWLSAPMFVIGADEDVNCSVRWRTVWDTHEIAPQQSAVVLSVLAGRSCAGSGTGQGGGSDEEVAMVIVARDAKQPVIYPAIATAVSRAQRCAPGTPRCLPSTRTVELAPAFERDRLTLAGPASWPALRRDDTGAILGVASDQTDASSAGSYRFAPP